MLRAPEPVPSDRRGASDQLARLARGAAAGDAQATRTLVVSVTPALLRTVRGVLGVDHPDVEDVVQEAALGFVNALAEFRQECTVLHFACRVGVLTALAARRKMRARTEGKLERAGIDEQIAGGASPADLALAARRRDALRDLCERLPEPQGEAVVMHFMLGFTVEEVADAAGVPANTVRSRLRLAKEALREHIALDPSLREVLEVRP
jgi:RNA polymerase sigma factor (sigma-70 family)